jgi:putative acetyltransferase
LARTVSPTARAPASAAHGGDHLFPLSERRVAQVTGHLPGIMEQRDRILPPSHVAGPRDAAETAVPRTTGSRYVRPMNAPVPSVSIRPYDPADEDAVIDLWLRASRAAHPFLDPAREDERVRKMREVYLVVADNHVAVDTNGDVVGLLGMLDNEIGGLFVRPDAQGRGIGRALVAHAVAERGTVTLEVYELNTRAREFYAANGFTETGRRPDEEAGGHVLIELRREA